MAAKETLTIAGISFELDAADVLLRPLADFNSAYSSFVTTGEKSCETPSPLNNALLVVRIRTCAIPPIDRSRCLMQTDSAWSIFAAPAGIDILFHPPQAASPLWIARFNKDEMMVDFFFDKGLVDADKGLAFHPLGYPLDQILAMHVLPHYGGGILHAAVSASSRAVFIFAGRSGAGKTTLARLIHRCAWSEVLSDDRAIIMPGQQSGYRVFGTPWPGEGGYARNLSRKLDGIFLIRHGARNKIEDLKGARAAAELFSLMSVPLYDRKLVEASIELCEDICSRVPVRRFFFRPDISSLKLLDSFL